MSMGEEHSRRSDSIDTSTGGNRGSEGGAATNGGRWRGFFEHAPLYFYMVSLDGKILDVNNTALKALGYRKDELVGEPLSVIYAPDQHQKMVLLFDKWKKEGVLIDEEIDITTKDGERRKVLLSSSRVADDNGAVRYSVSIQKDITEQWEIEEALKESEERHRTLFETMALGVVYQDSKGGIISANPAAERILGLTLDQMMGRTSIDSRWRAMREDGSDFPGEEHPAMVSLKTSKPVVNEIMGVYNPLEDSYRWISVTAIPLIRPGDDSPYQVYTTFSDITESKRLQEERARQHSELELYASLLRHDFGNDLQIIIGLIETYELADSSTVEEVEKLLTPIKAASGRMNSLLKALGMPHGERTESLSEMLTRVINAATNVHQELTVNLELPEVIGTLDVGSYRLLDTCCANLLRNSAEFGGDNVRVLIQIQMENGLITIRVSDNGPGVDSTILPNLFTRGATTNSGGLGLYLTKQILETYGGSITLEKNTPGKGATFMISLPITRQ